MRKKIGVGLLVILNLVYIYVVVIIPVLGFGLIVAELGIERGHEISNSMSKDIFTQVFAFSFIMILINYYLFRKLIHNNRPFLASLALTLIGVIVFIVYFLSSKNAFLAYQRDNTVLNHFLDTRKISNAQIITIKDTIEVLELEDLKKNLSCAKYKSGLWKYQKTAKLKFTMDKVTKTAFSRMATC